MVEPKFACLVTKKEMFQEFLKSMKESEWKK